MQIQINNGSLDIYVIDIIVLANYSLWKIIYVNCVRLKDDITYPLWKRWNKEMENCQKNIELKP